MKKLLAASLATVLSSSGLTLAQAPPAPPPIAAPTTGAVADSGRLVDPPACYPADGCDRCSRFWIGSEYLLWWVKGQPVPVPLATANAGAAPVLGAPGTVLLYGNSSQDMGTFSGLRITAGGWVNDARTVGLEASGFLLEQRTNTTFIGTDATGAPPLGLPFVTPAGVNSVSVASAPGFGVGSITVANTTRLWGYEADGLVNVARNQRWELDLLGGYRHMDLSEKLTFDNPFVFVGSGVSNPFHDIFQTRNQFYGGQLGARVGFNRSRLHLNATGKLALGVNHEEVNIFGTSTIIPPGGPISATAGGAYTSPSNIGRTTHNEFAVLPQVTLQAGYDLTEHLRATIGYDFLYLNQVVRPGIEIDPRFGVANGVAFPQSKFEKTDFWAQGISFGLELRF